jgi:heme/copper-type cytochrome/quinol oxidase subunit 2
MRVGYVMIRSKMLGVVTAGAALAATILATGKVAAAYAGDLMANPQATIVAHIDDQRFLTLMAMCVAFAALVAMVITIWTVIGRSTLSRRQDAQMFPDWPTRSLPARVSRV